MRSRIGSLSRRILDHYAGTLDENSIEYWQCYIFYVLAFAGTLLGTLSLASGLIVLIDKGRLVASLVFFALYAINVAAIFTRRIPIRAKTLVIAVNFHLFGVVSLLLAGPAGESGIWFSVSVLMCSLFVGLRTSVLFALLNFAAGATFGVLHTRGLMSWSMAGDVPFASWLLQSGNVFFVGMMFAVADTVLIKGVGRTFRSLNTAESRVRASLAEKETLIRELYHRTKNNMQVVSSLLILHSKELESNGAKDVFKDVVNKIGAMSLVHQKLYESQDLSNIDLADYLRDLLSLLMKSYAAATRAIALELDLESARILIDTAVPCGLLVSEIVSNSLKHAFPSGRTGKIQVVLRNVDEHDLELRIRDDGVGLPAGFQVGVDGRMGMRTLFNMVEHQLQGSIRVDTTDGVGYIVRFRGNLYDARVRTDV